MAKRLPATPGLPGSSKGTPRILAQPQASCRCLEGLLLPVEHNKALTTLANAEPVTPARKE